MSQHTPGPWNYTMDKERGWDFKVTADHGKTAIVSGCGCCDSPWVSCEADARLIAAAPELLEAIEAAIASGMVGGDLITSGPVTTTPQGEAAVMLRAARAKAKRGWGEPTMKDALAAGDGVIMTARRLRIEELEAENEQLRKQMRGWQPIETAPKDPWIKMLLWDGTTLGVGYRTDTEWALAFKLNNWEWGDETSFETVYPTHWMPLPEPPEEE